MLEAYEYCARKIAEYAKFGHLGEIDSYAYDGLQSRSLKTEAHLKPITLIVPARFAEDCAEQFDYVAATQAEAEIARDLPQHGYSMPPYGEGCMFGYYGPTAAWIYLHPEGPALIIREGDNDITSYVSDWWEYWLHKPNPRFHWPTSNTINEAFDLPIMPKWSGMPPLAERYLKGYTGRNRRAIRKVLNRKVRT